MREKIPVTLEIEKVTKHVSHFDFEEIISEIEEYIESADLAISDDEDYIRGRKDGLKDALDIIKEHSDDET